MNTTRRSPQAMGVGLATLLMVLAGLTPASAAPQDQPRSADVAAVAELQAEYKESASAQDYEIAMSVYEQLLRGEDATLPADVAPAQVETGTGPGVDRICVYVPKAALQAVAWIIIIRGGVTAIIGSFVDLTVVGIPLGAVLNALGVSAATTGSLFLWWVDNRYSSRTICV
jgi:hypothetical protein